MAIPAFTPKPGNAFQARAKPGQPDHIAALSGGGSGMPKPQAQAPVQGYAQKAAAAPKATDYSAYRSTSPGPRPVMSTTYAQPGGGWGHTPTQPGPQPSTMYAMSPQQGPFAAYPGANTPAQQPTQTYGDPRGNYANMPDGQRPPAFQESAQTPFGTMSPQDFYAQRAGFIDNINKQHSQFAQNAGIFGAADLPQNSAPDWSNIANMWPGQGGGLGPSGAPFGGQMLPDTPQHAGGYPLPPDPYGGQIRDLISYGGDFAGGAGEPRPLTGGPGPMPGTQPQGMLPFRYDPSHYDFNSPIDPRGPQVPRYIGPPTGGPGMPAPNIGSDMMYAGGSPTFNEADPYGGQIRDLVHNGAGPSYAPGYPGGFGGPPLGGQPKIQPIIDFAPGTDPAYQQAAYDYMNQHGTLEGFGASQGKGGRLIPRHGAWTPPGNIMTADFRDQNGDNVDDRYLDQNGRPNFGGGIMAPGSYPGPNPATAAADAAIVANAPKQGRMNSDYMPGGKFYDPSKPLPTEGGGIDRLGPMTPAERARYDQYVESHGENGAVESVLSYRQHMKNTQRGSGNWMLNGGGIKAPGSPGDTTAQQPISLPPPKPAVDREVARKGRLVEEYKKKYGGQEPNKYQLAAFERSKPGRRPPQATLPTHHDTPPPAYLSGTELPAHLKGDPKKMVSWQKKEYDQIMANKKKQTKGQQSAISSILGYTPSEEMISSGMYGGILRSKTGVQQQKVFGLNPG